MLFYGLGHTVLALPHSLALPLAALAAVATPAPLVPTSASSRSTSLRTVSHAQPEPLPKHEPVAIPLEVKILAS